MTRRRKKSAKARALQSTDLVSAVAVSGADKVAEELSSFSIQTKEDTMTQHGSKKKTGVKFTPSKKKPVAKSPKGKPKK